MQLCHGVTHIADCVAARLGPHDEFECRRIEPLFHPVGFSRSKNLELPPPTIRETPPVSSRGGPGKRNASEIIAECVGTGTALQDWSTPGDANPLSPRTISKDAQAASFGCRGPSAALTTRPAAWHAYPVTGEEETVPYELIGNSAPIPRTTCTASFFRRAIEPNSAQFPAAKERLREDVRVLSRCRCGQELSRQNWPLQQTSTAKSPLLFS